VADNGALTAGKLAQEVVPYIKVLAKRFLSEGEIVVVTMDAHQSNDSHFELWPSHNSVGTKAYGELYDWFQGNQDNDHLIYTSKANYNAFFQTDLAETKKIILLGCVRIFVTC
jgi:nicotinamidase-related amidase